MAGLSRSSWQAVEPGFGHDLYLIDVQVSGLGLGIAMRTGGLLGALSRPSGCWVPDTTGGDEMFAQLVLRGLLGQPASWPAAGVLEEPGMAAASHSTVPRGACACMRRTRDGGSLRTPQGGVR